MNSSRADRIPPALLRVALVSGFGALLLNLSGATLNVALDRIIVDLGTTLEVAQWTVTGYLLALTLVLPLFRFGAERVGLRRLYLASLVGFAVTSALCAGAWSIESLIVFRVLQGAIGGLLAPVAQALTAQHAGEGQFGRLLSIVAISVLAAPLLGPLLGGLLVQQLSWRWVFVVNVPLGVLCTLLCVRYLPRDEPAGARGRLDAIGLALLSPGLALIIYGITLLRVGGGLAWLAAGLVLLAVFVVYAAGRPQRALIDLRLFRQPVVAAGQVTYVLASIASFGGNLILPLYYLQVHALAPLDVGLLLGLQGLGMLISLPRVGRLSDRHDPGKLAMIGATITTIGSLPFAFVDAYASLPLLGLGLLLRGVGLGATSNPALAAVYRELPRGQLANATTALNIVQRMGAPLGTAILAVILQWQLGVRPPAEAFAVGFAVLAGFSALTIVSAGFLVGGGRPVAPVEVRRTDA